MSKIRRKYKLEKDMCKDLSVEAAKRWWIVYPEQGCWDLLLVKNGIQVGVQAKLRPNLKVFSQAVLDDPHGGGEPHFRAIAIGNLSYEETDYVSTISWGAKLVFIDMSARPDNWLHNHYNYRKGEYEWGHYYRKPEKTVWLPPVIANIEAGVSSPRTVSPWMIAALRLEEIYEEKGWVSIIDAREVVKRECPEKTFASNLLNVYYRCTTEKDPRKKRCRKWIRKKGVARPSKQYGHLSLSIKYH